jgi:hypothetical protein
MLPETREHIQREVDLLIALSASLLATKGSAAPEVVETYMSARQLCQHLDDPYQLFPVLRGLWNCYQVRPELQTAHTLGEQLPIASAALLADTRRERRGGEGPSPYYGEQ